MPSQLTIAAMVVRVTVAAMVALVVLDGDVQAAGVAHTAVGGHRMDPVLTQSTTLSGRNTSVVAVRRPAPTWLTP